MRVNVDRAIVMDGTHCDPSCPFLIKKDGCEGWCKLKNADLDWYDYYLAVCVDDVEII